MIGDEWSRRGLSVWHVQDWAIERSGGGGASLDQAENNLLAGVGLTARRWDLAISALRKRVDVGRTTDRDGRAAPRVVAPDGRSHEHDNAPTTTVAPVGSSGLMKNRSARSIMARLGPNVRSRSAHTTGVNPPTSPPSPKADSATAAGRRDLEAATTAHVAQLPRLYSAAAMCSLTGRPDVAVGYAHTAVELAADPRYTPFDPGIGGRV